MLRRQSRRFINRLFNFKTLFQINKRKGLEQNIKKRQTQNNSNHNDLNSNDRSINKLSNMKFLNSQFYPISLLLTPTMLSYSQMFQPSFLLGTMMAQNYACIALLANMNFYGDKKSIFLILTSMALLQTMPGYYSVLSPLGMALLTILCPFKFSNQKQKYKEIQLTRLKTMTNIRMSYFFIFIFLAILKAFHYSQIYQIERKMDQMNQQSKNQISLL